MTRVRFHPSAERETRAALVWYESRQPGLGEAFLAELDRALDSLAEHSAMWPMWPDIAPSLRIRRCLLARFPFGIAYSTVGDGIVVYAVTHLARRPGYWRGRIGTH